MSVTLSLQGNEGWDANGEQLIPGIPNEITLDHITPKLPWREFYHLSGVSTGWLRAIRGRHVHNARVRSGSMDPTAVEVLTCQDQYTIVLYSMKDKSWVELPPVPDLENGRGCQCVSLDGKVYVLGGRFSVLHAPGSDAVYALDVAGQKPWEKCANMSKPRDSFGCGVLNGKIFVFGGMSLGDPVDGSEVYDPKENMWSPISAMPTLRVGHRVKVVGEELFLHNGWIHPFRALRDIAGVHWNRDCLDTDPELSGDLDVYHPGKNTWVFRTMVGYTLFVCCNLHFS
ncbi:unnamed protein product [Calypogeia fissa]